MSVAGASMIEVCAGSDPFNSFPECCGFAELRLSTTYQGAKAHTHHAEGWLQAVPRTGFALKGGLFVQPWGLLREGPEGISIVAKIRQENFLLIGVIGSIFRGRAE